ncbi:MAG: hypothetical protein IJ859_01545, partial [Synergistaceae bacterium]|nr:hypothetical protein [Synergistaceae bacterium]
MKLKIFLFALIALLTFSSASFAYSITAPKSKLDMTYAKNDYNEIGELTITRAEGENIDKIKVKVTYDGKLSNGTNEVSYKLVTGGENGNEVSSGETIEVKVGEGLKIGAKITGDSSGVPAGEYKSNITFVGLPVKGQKDYEFGTYNGETLKWRVLEVDETNKALLVTEKAVTQMAYHATKNSYHWSTSDVKHFLNNNDAFLKVFATEDKAKILKVSITDGKEGQNK